jgi:hypothetical protein
VPNGFGRGSAMLSLDIHIARENPPPFGEFNQIFHA